MIRFIAIHHFGAPQHQPNADASRLSERDINETHKARWPNFSSQIDLKDFSKNYIGYNFIVWPSQERGGVRQYRPIGAETAANKGHNFDTISICMACNTNYSEPNEYQRVETSKLILKLFNRNFEGIVVVPNTTFDLHISRIVPHRFLQPDTECYGHKLPIDWGQKLVINYLNQRISWIQTLLQKMRQASLKVGGGSRGCLDNARG